MYYSEQARAASGLLTKQFITGFKKNGIQYLLIKVKPLLFKFARVYIINRFIATLIILIINLQQIFYLFIDQHILSILFFGFTNLKDAHVKWTLELNFYGSRYVHIECIMGTTKIM